jgi:hypothetical protein
VTCCTHPCKPCKVKYVLDYPPQGDESSPRGRWGICAPALPEVLTGKAWIEFKTMKESNAVEVAEYALANKISHAPVFDWWVHDLIRRKKRLIKLSQTRFLRPQYKYGICVPRNIKEAIKFDLENGNKFWEEAIATEMKNVHVAFKFLEPSEKPATG